MTLIATMMTEEEEVVETEIETEKEIEIGTEIGTETEIEIDSKRIKRRWLSVTWTTVTSRDRRRTMRPLTMLWQRLTGFWRWVHALYFPCDV